MSKSQKSGIGTSKTKGFLVDPVCGMKVDEKKAIKIKHKGKTYYFCNPTCQWAFKNNPGQFAEKK